MILNSQNKFSWGSIFYVARQYKTQIILANIIAILATLAAVPVPMLMPLMVDEVLLGNPGATLAFLDTLLPPHLHQGVAYIAMILAFTVLLRILSVALSVVQSRQFTIIAKNVTFEIRQVLVKRLGLIAISEYESIGSGGLTSHYVTDVETIDKFIGETLNRFIISLLSVLGTAAILLWINWKLGLFILLLNPVVIYFSKRLGGKVKHLKQRENSAFELFQQALVETLDGIYEIRAANKEKHYFKRILDKAKGVRDDSIAFAWQSEAAGKASFLVFLIGFEVFRATAMIMVLYTNLTVGEIFAVFGYLWFMMGPVQDLLGIQYSYFGATAALNRLNTVMVLNNEPNYNTSVDPFAQQNTVAIELRDVKFSYNKELEVIRGISLTIARGEKVALVGASGGGKSTMVQLLLGLYTKSSGEILIDGQAVEQVGFDKIRSNISTVLQSPSLFNDSIRNNLTWGKHYSEEQIWHALDIAQLKDFVWSLDNKLDTQVGQRGVRLSGGQKQRLAIARMVLSDPKVVILDEATSALDTETETNLHQALSDFLNGRTCIIVAHRLSSVRQADRIVVFEDGLISQTGSHHELISQPGLYKTLYGGHH